LLVYKLGGEANLPATPEVRTIPTPPPRHGSEESIVAGQVLYNTHCGRCHGAGLEGGLLPDLRDMGHDGTANTPEVFKAIVLQGAYREMGMVSFADVLSETDAEAVYDYIVDAAHTRLEEREASPFWRDVEAWFMDLAGALIVWFI
ncbi:MAG: c-type cytochrome, partial [Proteobacteria bacterium]|nr:c-type cytochrome [Pseudomonadota bacterium]